MARDHELFQKRTAIVKSASNLEIGESGLTVKIMDVVKEKGEGYTVIVELPPNAEINSEEAWRVALPGDFRGATRVDRLWHLYYGEKPSFSAGETLTLPSLQKPAKGYGDELPRDAAGKSR